MKIFLDAGHRNNSFDFGASNGSIKESELALSLCKKLKIRLKQLGYFVVETRPSEKEVITLETRVKMANSMGANLFLSIHINAASNKDAQGVEILHYQGDAERRMSQLACDEICKRTGQRNRGAKVRNDLYVLNSTKCKALLVEAGFISNEEECKKLQDENFQNAIVEGILAGLGLNKEESGIVANVKIKLSDIARIETVVLEKRATARQVYDKYKPDYMINGVLFDMASGGILTNIKADSQKYGYMFATEGISIRWDKTLGWHNKATVLESGDIKQWIAGAPTLIKDGKKHIDLTDCKPSFASASAIRTAIGFSDKELLLVATGSNYTFSGLADWMLGQGCQYAVSTDGGGSTVLMQNGKQLNKTYDGRLIPHWILVYLNKEETAPDKEESVKVTKTKIELNGKEKEVEAIHLNGTNYIKLRSLESEEIKIGYDAVKKIPTVTTK